MSERVIAWQCIGCGRVEASQPCIGVCRDRKVEFVYASDYEAALAALARARSEIDALTALVRQIGHTRPRHGEYEPTYRALQKRARHLLERLSRFES